MRRIDCLIIHDRELFIIYCTLVLILIDRDSKEFSGGAKEVDCFSYEECLVLSLEVFHVNLVQHEHLQADIFRCLLFAFDFFVPDIVLEELRVHEG